MKICVLQSRSEHLHGVETVNIYTTRTFATAGSWESGTLSRKTYGGFSQRMTMASDRRGVAHAVEEFPLCVSLSQPHNRWPPPSRCVNQAKFISRTLRPPTAVQGNRSLATNVAKCMFLGCLMVREPLHLANTAARLRAACSSPWDIL